jgi:transposase
LLAVGIDPAKRVHRAIGVLYPDTVVLDVEFPNQIEACRNLDARLVALADQHGADLVYGLEDHRQYGRTIAQVLSGLNRQIRVVNPLWTNRQRAFYGQDKDDAVDARCVAAVVLRRGENLPDAHEVPVNSPQPSARPNKASSILPNSGRPASTGSINIFAMSIPRPTKTSSAS